MAVGRGLQLKLPPPLRLQSRPTPQKSSQPSFPPRTSYRTAAGFSLRLRSRMDQPKLSAGSSATSVVSVRQADFDVYFLIRPGRRTLKRALASRHDKKHPALSQFPVTTTSIDQLLLLGIKIVSGYCFFVYDQKQTWRSVRSIFLLIISSTHSMNCR